jgi:Tol biopolymer transport system component
MRGPFVAGLLVFVGCGGEARSPELLATASQMGPVGYRDPAGGISPDGERIAYTQGRTVVVAALSGGATTSLGPAPSQVRYVTWLPDGRQLAVHERSFDRRAQWWTVYDVSTGTGAALWPDRAGEEGGPELGRLLELSWAPDGGSVVGVVRTGGQSQVWSFDEDGRGATLIAEGDRLGLPAFSPDGVVACVARQDGRQFLHYPCGEGPVEWMGDHQPYGHVAFSPDGSTLYYSAPGPDGALELWSRPVGGGTARRLAAHARDAYGPTVTRDGRLVYKSQDYMVSLAAIRPTTGEVQQLTTFQSETPTWSPDGAEVSFTFGGWRIATDDVNYPDIDQHIGIIAVDGAIPRSAPDRVVRSSYSEDQGMHWSPNGQWVAYHSHIDGTDDIYLIPSDDPSAPRLISRDGYETGWPRWSPDGRWIAFPTYTRDESGARRSDVYVIPADESTGETGPQQLVELVDFSHDALQAEWLPDSERIVFEAAEGPGRKALYWVHREGGVPVRFHEWESDQVFSGIAVSPDGDWVAYIGPGEGGFFQVFRVPFGGGEAEQLTTDQTQKTQPAYSPDGERLAYTVFRYLARFYEIRAS